MIRAVSFAFALIFLLLEGAAGGPAVAASRAEGQGEGPDLPPAAVARFAKAMLDLDENRLADGLEAHLATLGDDEEVQVIVSLTAPGRARAFARQIGPFTVTQEFDVIDGFAATMTAGQAQQLAALPGIFRVEEDLTAEALMDVSRMSVGADAVVDLGISGYSGTGVTVCVIDSGAMGSHEMFTEDGASSRFLGFTDYVGTLNSNIDTSAPPYDDNFLAHGTNVTGMIGGDGEPNSLDPTSDPINGPASLGVAPGVDFLIARTMDHFGRGLVSDIVDAIDWCLAHPSGQPKIINLSLGVPGETRCRDALCRAAENAVKGGTVVVAAIGNFGDAPGTAFSPAISAKVIGVGAAAEFVDYALDAGLGAADGRLSGGLHPLASNSQGPGSKGSVKPDVIAPGSTVLSAANDDHVLVAFNFFGELVVLESDAKRGCGNGCYAFNLSGSSQAAGFVSGIVALMLEADPSLTPAEVQQILQQTADDRLLPGPDNITGYGLVNAYQAVATAAGDATAPGIPAFPYKDTGSVVVPAASQGYIDIPIQIQDEKLSFAITLAIEGDIISFFDFFGQLVNEWNPDIDASLYFSDSLDGLPIALSWCPAAECGTQSAGKVGQMEVIGVIFEPADFVAHTTDLTLRLASQVTPVHSGESAVVHYDISNGKVVTPPPSGAPVADAGPDQTVTDADNNGMELVTLDGSGSSGIIDSYSWRDGGASGPELASGPTPTIALVQDQYTIALVVSNNGVEGESDTVLITVKRKKGGGSGGGGCGKGNNPPC